MNGFNINFSKKFYEDFNIEEDSISKIPINTKPLCEILDAHICENQIIDFLSVDVEGNEEEILLSNNWQKYRPIVVMIENHKPLGDKLFTDKLKDLMLSANYLFAYKTPNEVLFLNKDYNLSKSGIIELDE